jgi:DNA-binding transcriptional ArsR family regulator
MVYHQEMSIATTQLDEDASLDRVFRALGDPTRRAIISQLTAGEATMTEIADRFEMSLPGVSKHVGVLEDAGLVHRWRSGRSRRCRLDVERIQAANSWLVEQSNFWNQTLGALAHFIEDEGSST